MPSVQIVKSYNPIGSVTKTGRKVTQKTKLGNYAITWNQFFKMIKEQKLESFQPMAKTNDTIIKDYDLTYMGSFCYPNQECDNCRGSF